MFSKFFIERPIFATVISLVIILAGLVSIKVLPIEQYPSIVPTEIQISATYPGATAEVLADTVAAPIEQELNGVKNMIYMYLPIHIKLMLILMKSLVNLLLLMLFKQV